MKSSLRMFQELCFCSLSSTSSSSSTSSTLLLLFSAGSPSTIAFPDSMLIKLALLMVFNTFSCFLKLPPACLSWLFMSFCCSLTALNNCTTPLVAILVKVLSAFRCKGFGILLPMESSSLFLAFLSAKGSRTFPSLSFSLALSFFALDSTPTAFSEFFPIASTLAMASAQPVFPSSSTSSSSSEASSSPSSSSMSSPSPSSSSSSSSSPLLSCATSVDLLSLFQSSSFSVSSRSSSSLSSSSSSLPSSAPSCSSPGSSISKSSPGTSSESTSLPSSEEDSCFSPPIFSSPKITISCRSESSNKSL